MFTTYVLKSLMNGRLYVGSTCNLARRIYEHNSGNSRYTKSTRPFVLVYFENFDTRTEAVRRELFFKTGHGKALLKEIIGITVA